MQLRQRFGSQTESEPARAGIASGPSVFYWSGSMYDTIRIGSACTYVRAFALNANACPKGSIYGRARAFTPPLEGPVYLRSSNNNLPDAVFALKGIVDIEVVVRIDSVRGGLRATVARAPDAPVSRVIVKMRGGQKGLLVNSRNLCAGKRKNRARVRLDAHNGIRRVLRPVVRPQCKKKRRAGRNSHGRSARRG